jgi:hypothetical protein
MHKSYGIVDYSVQADPTEAWSCADIHSGHGADASREHWSDHRDFQRNRVRFAKAAALSPSGEPSCRRVHSSGLSVKDMTVSNTGYFIFREQWPMAIGSASSAATLPSG